jgi:FkbM family methyltransferase
MTFFDVGAHFGYFTLLGAHLVGRGGSVHSFEPTPTTFSVLEANTARLPQVTLNRVAVWSRCEELTFRDFGVRLSMYNSLFAPRLSDQDAARASASVITVPAVSVDHYVTASGAIPHFVKIDAESAEREVLLGMTETVRRHRPIISIEVGDYDVAGAASSRDLLASVIAKGYRAFEFRDGKIVKHRLRDRYRYDNILLLPR